MTTWWTGECASQYTSAGKLKWLPENLLWDKVASVLSRKSWSICHVGNVTGSFYLMALAVGRYFHESEVLPYATDGYNRVFICSPHSQVICILETVCCSGCSCYLYVYEEECGCRVILLTWHILRLIHFFGMVLSGVWRIVVYANGFVHCRDRLD